MNVHINDQSTLLIMLFVFQFFCSCGQQTKTPPVAKTENIKEVMHGVEVNDPYRWLEEWEDQQVRSWSDTQNSYARNILNNLPGKEELTKRIGKILRMASVSYFFLTWNNGMLFAEKHQPPLNQSLLVTMSSAGAPESERIIVDPNKIDTSGGTTIDWYVPSPDGQFVAVSLSVGGSESGDVHIFETATAKEQDEVIERVNGGTAGGDLTWLPDGSGFFYTRYPRAGERAEEDLNFYQQVWFHKMGTSCESDRYVMGKDFPRIAEIRLTMDDKSGRLLVTVQYGDSGRFSHYIVEPDGTWKQITDYDDQIVQVLFGPDNTLLLISLRNAPRGKIQRLSLAKPTLKKAETIIPENENTVVSSFSSKSTMVATPSRLYVTYQTGGPSEIRVFDHDGHHQNGPDILPVSSIYEITPLDGDDILYRNGSYIEPPAWYRFNAAEAFVRKTALVNTYPVDFSDSEVIREVATSKNGTKIPINIIRRKTSKLDGSNPVLLTGYGGFGASNSPGFNPTIRVWIEQGGIYAVANIRGGGEFGEEWHHAGMLTHKQNVFDDFAAAMKHMVDAGYTNPEKLAIMGGSNGGLLMGAMIAQHPELFKATVSRVGIYDMIRSELTPNGTFNIPEYGTVKDPEQFRALYAYSPYHNVKDSVAYPAILFMTGANDPRVDPMHSRKMTARLQAVSISDSPILLRTSSSTGHGMGTPLSERIKEIADMYAFLFHQLGIQYKSVE